MTEHPEQVEGAVEGVEVRFTDRTGGVSFRPYDTANLATHVGDDAGRVAENRQRAIPGPVAWMEQVHGARVAVVDAAPDGPVPGVDALVSRRAGLWLAVLVADCVPVILAEPVAGVVAVAHAGRRGMVAGVVPACLHRMIELGARADRTRAWLGPSICAGCYELSEIEAEAVARRVPPARARTRAGTPAADLAAGVRSQLLDAGLAAAAVWTSPACTAESPQLYSYRRDGRTGRFAGLVRLDGAG